MIYGIGLLFIPQLNTMISLYFVKNNSLVVIKLQTKIVQDGYDQCNLLGGTRDPMFFLNISKTFCSCTNNGAKNESS